MAADRRKSDGALLVTDKPMSLRECIAWCGFYAGITGLAIAAAYGVITGLSPSVEPVPVSPAPPHQSLSHGDAP